MGIIEIGPRIDSRPAREDILTDERILRGVLGYYYDGILSFIKEALSDDFDIKIFMTRRGYVLYKMFSKLAPNVEIKGEIVTPYAICGYFGKLAGKRVLIVDDAIKQGWSMLKLCGRLKDLGVNERDIETRALAKCKEAQSYRMLYPDNKRLLPLNELWENTKKCCYVFERWNQQRSFSESLTWSLHAVLEPYISYLPAMRVQREKLRDKIAQHRAEGGKMEIYKGKHPFCSYTLIFTDYFDGEEGGSSAILSECVRVYENDEHGYATVVPDLLFKDSALETALNHDGFSKAFCALIGDGIPLRGDASSQGSVERKIIAECKCKLAIYLSSLIYGIRFMKDLRINRVSEFNPDLKGFEMSFGREMAERVRELLKNASLDRVLEAFPSDGQDRAQKISGGSSEELKSKEQLLERESEFYEYMDKLLHHESMGRLLAEESRESAEEQESRNVTERFMAAMLRRYGKFDEKKLLEYDGEYERFGIPQEWPYEKLSGLGIGRKRVFAAALAQIDRAVATKKIKIRELKSGKYTVNQRYVAGERAFEPLHPEYIIMLFVIHRIREEFDRIEKSIAEKRMASLFGAYKMLAASYCAKNGLSYVENEANVYLDIYIYKDDNMHRFDSIHQYALNEGRGLMKLLDIGGFLLPLCEPSETTKYLDGNGAFDFKAFSEYCEGKGASWLAELAKNL